MATLPADLPALPTLLASNIRAATRAAASLTQLKTRAQSHTYLPSSLPFPL